MNRLGMSVVNVFIVNAHGCRHSDPIYSCISDVGNKFQSLQRAKSKGSSGFAER